MKEQIEEKIAEFERQKESMAQVSQIKGSNINESINAILFLDKQIALLKWVLTLKPS
jgi:hypothetical protein